MLLSDRTSRGVEACYDAVLAPDRWSAALQLLGESLGAESCTFAPSNGVDGPFRIPRSDGHEDFAQLWLKNEPHAPDPHNGLRRLTRGRSDFLLEEDVTNEEQRRSLPYFRETAHPGNRDWWASAHFTVEGRGWCLPLYRGAKRGPFTVPEAHYFIQVVPHLSRIVGLAEKFARLDTTNGLNLLQRLGTAAIVIDGTGIARHINSAAEAMIGPDFNLVRGRPTATDRAGNRRLQSLIAAALATQAGAAEAPEPSVVPRDGAPWLLVETMPVTALGSDVFATGRVVLLLTDLTEPLRPREKAFGAAFGLTPAEARLACRIASGAGIDEAAAALGISRETVRSQLKAVFAKTGTRTQAGLAALAGRMRS